MAKYVVTANGEILRDEEVIGSFNVETGQITVPPGMAASAENYIKAQVFDLVVARLKGKAGADEKHEGLPPGLADLPERPPPSEVPPAPEMDPKLGDKTPAYMQWLGTYFPEKYKEQFKGRKTHLTTGLNPHLSQSGDVPDSHFRKEPDEEWR